MNGDVGDLDLVVVDTVALYAVVDHDAAERAGRVDAVGAGRVLGGGRSRYAHPPSAQRTARILASTCRILVWAPEQGGSQWLTARPLSG